MIKKCDKKFFNKMLNQHKYLEKTFEERGNKFDDKFSLDLAKSHKINIKILEDKLRKC